MAKEISRDEIKIEVIAALIKQLGRGSHVIQEEDSLVKDLGVDSLDLLELSIKFEGIWTIEIDEERLNKDLLTTVGALIDLIHTFVNPQ